MSTNLNNALSGTDGRKIRSLSAHIYQRFDKRIYYLQIYRALSSQHCKVLHKHAIENLQSIDLKYPLTKNSTSSVTAVNIIIKGENPLTLD